MLQRRPLSSFISLTLSRTCTRTLVVYFPIRFVHACGDFEHFSPTAFVYHAAARSKTTRLLSTWPSSVFCPYLCPHLKSRVLQRWRLHFLYIDCSELLFLSYGAAPAFGRLELTALSTQSQSHLTWRCTAREDLVHMLVSCLAVLDAWELSAVVNCRRASKLAAETTQ